MSVNKQRFAAFWRRFGQRFSTLNWITALWSVALFFVFPVVAVFKFTDIPLYDVEYFILKTIEGQLYFVSALSIFVAAITTNSFNYLNSKTQLDFFHSQPVTRKELFFTNYFAGWLSFAAPLTTAFLLEAIVIFAFNGFLTEPLSALAWGYAGCMGVYFAVNAIFTLAVMLCGTRFTSLVTGTFLCVAPIFTVYMIKTCFFMMSDTYTVTHSSFADKIAACVNPFVFIYDTVPYSFDIIGFRVPAELLDNLWIRGVWLLISAALVITALWLYTRRKSEDAEKAFVFPRAIPFLRYPAVILFAWLGGIIFGAIATKGFWSVFGTVISGVLAFFLSEIIIKKSFAGAFRAWKKILICAAAYAGCILVIYAGALLFDTRTAKDENIVAVDVQTIIYGKSGREGFRYTFSEYGHTIFHATTEDAIKNLNKIFKAGAKNSILNGTNKSTDESKDAYINITAKIYTKSGSFERQYVLRCDAAGDMPKAMDGFLYSAEVVQEQQKTAFSALDHNQHGFVLKGAEKIISKGYAYILTDAEKLYEALKADIENADISDYDEEPLGTVYFYYACCSHTPVCYNFDPQKNHSYGQYIDVYPSYENTLKILGEDFRTEGAEKDTIGHFGQQ